MSSGRTLPRGTMTLFFSVLWLLSSVICSTGFADCKSELVATQQGLEATRAGVEQAADGPAAARCTAHRRHYAAMVKFRDLLGRCDTGKTKAENLAQLNASIDDFRKKMPPGCQP